VANLQKRLETPDLNKTRIRWNIHQESVKSGAGIVSVADNLGRWYAILETIEVASTVNSQRVWVIILQLRYNTWRFS
jgi:hypothetical protein